MFGRRPKGKVVLVADVEDLRVGVSIVELPSTHGPATVLVSERATLLIEERHVDQSIVAIGKLLEATVETALKKYTSEEKSRPRPIQGSYAILKSPWTKLRTADAEEVFKEPKTITKDLIAALAKKALQKPSDLDMANILEMGVMHVYLNGYPTGNPLGKKVTRAGVIAYQSDVSFKMKKLVVEVLAKILPGRAPVIRSGMSAMIALMNEHLPDIHRYVVIDVGGGITSFAVFLKESFSRNATVQEGVVSILKRVSAVGLPEEMLSQLRMLSLDSCATESCRALKDSLARAEPELTKVFGEAFAHLASQRRLPNSAMLAAPLELSPWLQGFFSRIDFSQFTATMQPLTVEPLTPEHLHDVVTWKPGVSPDTGNGIAAGYVNILREHT